MTDLELETLNLVIGAELDYKGSVSYVIGYDKEQDNFIIDVCSEDDNIEPVIVCMKRNELVTKYKLRLHQKIVDKLEKKPQTSWETKMTNIDKKVQAYYEYEHVNGTKHRKPAFVVDMGGGPSEYFNSPFVKSWKLVVKP